VIFVAFLALAPGVVAAGESRESGTVVDVRPAAIDDIQKAQWPMDFAATPLAPSGCVLVISSP
jgi:hypothetical protein